jgi:hypothetical protein
MAIGTPLLIVTFTRHEDDYEDQLEQFEREQEALQEQYEIENEEEEYEYERKLEELIERNHYDLDHELEYEYDTY